MALAALAGSAKSAKTVGDPAATSYGSEGSSNLVIAGRSAWSLCRQCRCTGTATHHAHGALTRDRIARRRSLPFGAKALCHVRHHLQREHRRLLDQEQEHPPVDHGQLGVGNSDNRRTSRGGVDDCHLTERIVGAKLANCAAGQAHLHLPPRCRTSGCRWRPPRRSAFRPVPPGRFWRSRTGQEASSPIPPSRRTSDRPRLADRMPPSAGADVPGHPYPSRAEPISPALSMLSGCAGDSGQQHPRSKILVFNRLTAATLAGLRIRAATR